MPQNYYHYFRFAPDPISLGVQHYQNSTTGLCRYGRSAIVGRLPGAGVAAGGDLDRSGTRLLGGVAAVAFHPGGAERRSRCGNGRVGLGSGVQVMLASKRSFVTWWINMVIMRNALPGALPVEHSPLTQALDFRRRLR